MKKITTLYKNAYGGLSREVWLLSVMQFINRCGTMVFPFLSVYLNESLQFDLNHVGIVMACFGAGSLLGVFMGGKLVDKVGPYQVMLLSLITGGILFLVLSFIQDFLILCFGMFILSAFSEAFRPAGMVAISQYSDKENYTRSISLYRLAMNLGFSIGPAIGGVMAAINYKFIFWADGVTCLAAGLMLLMFLKPEKTNAPHSKAAEDDTSIFASPFKDNIYLFFLPIVMIYAITFFQFFTTMAIFYKHEAHMSELEIGALLALNGAIVAAVELIMIYKIEKKASALNWIILGSLLVTLSYLLLLFVGSIPWLIAITVIISFSEMFAMPFMNTFMNERASKAKKGQYASLYVMSWSVAQIATPIVATQVMDKYGYNKLWIVMASLSLVVLIQVYFLKRMVLNENKQIR